MRTLLGRRDRRSSRRGIALVALVSSIAFLAVASPSSARATGVLYPIDGPVVASTIEGPAYAARNAVDQDSTTRWSSAFADNQWLQLDLGTVQPLSAVGLDWETARPTTFKIQVSTDGVAFRDATAVLAGPGDVPQIASHYVQSASVDVTARFVRIVGLTRATRYGFSLWNVNVQYYSNLGRCAQNIGVAGDHATASSVQSASTPAAAAVDGDVRTRWSSAFSDDQWLQVDIGRPRVLCKVRLNWEAAYAKTFVVQGSTDGVTFTDISRVASGYDGFQSVAVSGVWQFVRIKGLTRATPYGYSLWELSLVDEGVPPPPGS